MYCISSTCPYCSSTDGKLKVQQRNATFELGQGTTQYTKPHNQQKKVVRHLLVANILHWFLRGNNHCPSQCLLCRCKLRIHLDACTCVLDTDNGFRCLHLTESHELILWNKQKHTPHTQNTFPACHIVTLPPQI